MPAWLTILIGLVGTRSGVGSRTRSSGRDLTWIDIGGFIFAIVLVLAYRRFVQKRAIWGPDAYRFPKRGVGVEDLRQRLQSGYRSRHDRGGDRCSADGALGAGDRPESSPRRGDDPTENPAHYLRLLDELHDNGVLERTSTRRRERGYSSACARRLGSWASVFLVVLALSGLVVGALARLALPGPDPMSIPATIGLGLGGSFLGGVVARVLLGTGGGLIFAVLAATCSSICTAASCSTGR